MTEHELSVMEEKLFDVLYVAKPVIYLVTPLFYTAVTLLSHCCYTVVTLLLHYCHTVVVLLLHRPRILGKPTQNPSVPHHSCKKPDNPR
jgi:hypothetical protein